MLDIRCLIDVSGAGKTYPKVFLNHILYLALTTALTFAKTAVWAMNPLIEGQRMDRF